MSLATNNWIARNRRRIEQEERKAWARQCQDERDKAEEMARREAYEKHQARRDALYDVPDRAKDAYIAMEDNFGPETVKDFMNAMLETDT